MKRSVRTGVIVSAVAAGLGLTVPGCDTPASQADTLKPPVELVILTPHNQAITNAFGFGFSQWYYDKYGKRVAVRFINRGTPQCLQYLDDAFNQGAESAPTLPDILFGGGVADHEEVAQRGHSRAIELGDALSGVPEEIGGVPTRDAAGRWYATGLSSFGIYYNAKACAARGLPAPTTWGDLADARWSGWVGLADPRASGSTRESLLLLLRSTPEQGWSNLTRILANSRGLCRSSGDALDGVETGVFLAAPAVNFDAQQRVAATGAACVYVNPPGATAASPDVISVLNSRGEAPAAVDFVKFVRSERGQLIWSGDSSHSPTGSEPLYHYPIRPEIYEKFADTLCVRENPFAASFGLDAAAPAGQGRALLLLIEALTGENHIPLQQAWAQLSATGAAAKEPWAELVRPPFGDDWAEIQQRLSAAEPVERETLVNEWAREFSQRLAAFRAQEG